MNENSPQSNAVQTADMQLMHSVIQRVATGPELSKNISREEAEAVMKALMDGSADPVQAGVFLIGLRMKRETDEEMKGILNALLGHCQSASVEADDVVLLAEPYNGFNRTEQASLAVLPVLAACDVAAYSTGVESVGPKYGVTHHTTLRALGGNAMRTVDDVATRLGDRNIGWGYLDQAVFCAPLHDLTSLRRRIVKRPVLTTLEVLLNPLQGRTGKHLVTGYVHKPYPPIYSMLARHSGYQSCLLIRGTEGGVIPSFRSKGKVVRYVGDEADQEFDIQPADMQLQRDYRAADIAEDMPKAAAQIDKPGIKWDIDALSQRCADACSAALNAQPGPAFDAAVMGAALVLWHLGRADSLDSAASLARTAITSGEALKRLQAGL